MLNNDFLSPVFEGMQPSPTLYINETVNEFWSQGKEVFHMGFGESRFDVHPSLQQALRESANQKSYLPARGLLELRKTVASYYSTKLDHEFETAQVIIGPGSKALIFGLQMVLDTDLFLPTPSWVSYEPQAQLLGKKVFYIQGKASENYQLSISALDEKVRNSQNPNKLLVINSPNNPTGQVLEQAFLKELAEYCRENSILVLSDEIYFLVQHGASKHSSIAHFYPEGTFVLGGLSKHLSLGGWRLGVALLPATELGAQVMEALAVVASETWSSVAAPVQSAAILAYSGDSEIENYIQACAGLHATRTRYIYDRLKSLGIRCTEPQGGFYLTANFDFLAAELRGRGVHTSEQLAQHLLEKRSIASLPGSAFGIPTAELSLRLSTSYLDFEKPGDAERLLGLYTSGARGTALMESNYHPQVNKALGAFEAFVQPL